MRLDYLTIFPEYLDVLRLSLTGKAIDQGLVEVHVHDLRTWTHDRHRTVDDAPYGGGAGMVMRPEPWGEAFDELGLDGATLVVPTPAGRRFTQALARDLAGRPRLVFACGRYEGIDQRVVDHAATRAEVVEVSLGDYVLNGGEVAALAVTEAVVRLLPGFVGNAESIVEESHEGGLLEHPVYTRPPSWRGLDVPDVLQGGDHAAIARVAGRPVAAPHGGAAAGPRAPEPRGGVGDRARRARRRRRDPDPAAGVLGAGGAGQRHARHPGAARVPGDGRGVAGRLGLLRRAGRGPARRRRPRHGSRPTPAQTVWDIGRVMVAPDLQGRGLGRALLEHIQAVAPAAAASYSLFTGARSEDNLRMYKKAGFSLRRDLPAPPGARAAHQAGIRRV